MARTPSSPATPAPDPLADLRAKDEPPADVQPPAADAPTAPPEGPSPSQSQAVARVAEQVMAHVVATWHADPTASSFGHGGGTCGCRYLVGLGILAVRQMDLTVFMVDGDG